MSEHDLDVQLRAAGARLRGDEPSAAETDDALSRVQERPARRSPWRWMGPALVVGAAAASIIGVLVVTQPEDTLRQVPADTTVPTSTTVAPTTPPVVVPDTEPGPATTVGGTVVAPVTSPVVTAPPSSVATTTTSAPPVESWVVSVTDTGFDGDGGACLAVAPGVDPAGPPSAAGCVEGAHIRAGRSAYAVVDGTPLLITTDGATGTAAELPDAPEYPGQPTADCLVPSTPGDRLLDVVACSDDLAIAARLRSDPGGAVEWFTTGWAGQPSPPTVRPADVGLGADVRVVTVTGTVGGNEMHCTVIAVGGTFGWRESCAPAGQARWILGGHGDRPVLVEVDAAGDVAGAAGVDPALAPLANGCRAQLAALMGPYPNSPAGSAMTGLRCVDGAAITELGSVLVQRDGPVDGGITLQRDAGDGTWPIGDSGTSLTCARYAATCAEFHTTTELGEAMLPLPSPAALTDLLPDSMPSDRLLDPVDETERYAGVGTVADVEALYPAVDGAWRAEGDDVTQSTPGSFGRPPLVLTFTSIPDDSVGDVVLAVWWSPDAGGVGIDAVVSITSCRRGVTELDGREVCV